MAVAVALGLVVDEVALPWVVVVELPECPVVEVVTAVVTLVEGMVGEPEAVTMVVSAVPVGIEEIAVGKDDGAPLVGEAGGWVQPVVVPVPVMAVEPVPVPTEPVPVPAEPVPVPVLAVTVWVIEPETEVVNVLVVVAYPDWVVVYQVVSLLGTLLATGMPVGVETLWVAGLPGVVSEPTEAVGEVEDT